MLLRLFVFVIEFIAASDTLQLRSRLSAPLPIHRRSSSPGIIRNLPGPSQVLTHPGQSGTNPVTGARQRRRGVSGPPSGIFS